MGSPYPPPAEVCERAWELYSGGGGWREVARKLTAEGHKCSHETARQWGLVGKKIYMRKKDIDPGLQQYRFADFLEQWMGRLGAYADGAELEDILAITAQLKWMYEARARLIGINAPPPTKTKNVHVTSEHVEPQGFIQRGVAKAWPDPEETFGDPNGHP